MNSGIASIRSHGVIATAKVAATYLAQNFIGSRPDLVQHRYFLGQEISQRFNHTVRYGPFAGLKFAADSRWSAADRGSMLLGMYEKEVLDAYARYAVHCDAFIDVGAADGYYAIGGLVAEHFVTAVCFEIDPKGQEVIRQQARLNGVLDRIDVRAKATTESLR